MNRELIDKPFPESVVKTRPGNFGQQLCYVEAYHYIDRLNEAFDGDWSFEIVEHIFDEKEVIVKGKLSAAGIVKFAFGGSEITRRKDDSEMISLADDLKAASTDALKKAASLFGIGLHLYRDEKTDIGKSNGDKKQVDKNTTGRLTSRQLQAIIAIGRERGIDRKAIKDMALEQFGKTLEFLSKAEASDMIGDLQSIAKEARQ